MTIELAGCTIERRNGADGDIEEFSPPVVPIAQQTATMTTTPTPEPTTTITSTPTLESTAVITPTFTPVPTTLTPTATLTPIPTPASIPAPSGATIGFCYRVLRGETIYSLAQRFDTSPYAINLANDLFPPNLVYTYQALFIPTELGRGPNVYIFAEGDTLDSIAEKCGLPASMIAGVNKPYSDIPFRAGDAVIIPIPPFPPPARFGYPTGPLPLVPYPPPCCNYAYPPYRPGPPLHK